MSALENAKRRGKGEICAGGMGNGGLEGGINVPYLSNAIDDFPRSELPKGYCDEGSIKGDTKSNPAAMVPGRNNRNSRI